MEQTMFLSNHEHEADETLVTLNNGDAFCVQTVYPYYNEESDPPEWECTIVNEMTAWLAPTNIAGNIGDTDLVQVGDTIRVGSLNANHGLTGYSDYVMVMERRKISKVHNSTGVTVQIGENEELDDDGTHTLSPYKLVYEDTTTGGFGVTASGGPYGPFTFQSAPGAPCSYECELKFPSLGTAPVVVSLFKSGSLDIVMGVNGHANGVYSSFEANGTMTRYTVSIGATSQFSEFVHLKWEHDGENVVFYLDGVALPLEALPTSHEGPGHPNTTATFNMEFIATGTCRNVKVYGPLYNFERYMYRVNSTLNATELPDYLPDTSITNWWSNANKTAITLANRFKLIDLHAPVYKMNYPKTTELKLTLDRGIGTVHRITLIGYHIKSSDSGVYDSIGGSRNEDYYTLRIKELQGGGGLISNKPTPNGCFAVLSTGHSAHRSTGAIEYEMHDPVSGIASARVNSSQPLKTLTVEVLNMKGELAKVNKLHLWFKLLTTSC